MEIQIKTCVSASLAEVKNRFDRNLFESLSPGFPKVSVLRFDGCRTGDEVHLRLHFFLFSQLWISEIIKEEEMAQKWAFVDIGKQLPFPVKSWKHIHSVEQFGIHSVITDHIFFSSGFLLTDQLLFPFMYLLFKQRQAIYRQVFGIPGLP